MSSKTMGVLGHRTIVSGFLASSAAAMRFLSSLKVSTFVGSYQRAQRIAVAGAVAELDNDVVGPVLLRIGDNLEAGQVVGVSSSGADEIVQTVIVGDTQIGHVGILLADAQLRRSGERTKDRKGRIVLPPQHQIRVITIMIDAELPSILADALADADALLSAVILDLHGAAVGTSDGGPPFSSKTTSTAAAVPVDLIGIGLWATNAVLAVVLAKRILEAIFLPLGEGLVADRLGDGVRPGPGADAVLA